MTDSMSRSDRYTALETLARGPQSSLVRALDNQTDSDVALKIVHAPLWMSPVEADIYLSRVSDALAPLTGLSSPGVAPIQSIERTDVSVVIAREFVTGKPLSHLIESRWVLGAYEARRIACEVGAAVDSLTAAGVPHRALTPSNIIVRETGEFVVTDPGVRYAASRFSVAGLSCAIRPHREQRDVHALAKLVCRAATGLDPDTSPAAMCALPAEMRESIRRALGRDRAFRTASELARSLEPVPTSALFRYAWRPAAATGLLASLVTLGGNAVSEARNSASSTRRGPAHVVAATPLVKMLPNILDTISPEDAEALTAAVRSKGPALLAHPAVADLLEMKTPERIGIDACLAEHRARVGELVETAAAGRQVDTATAMAELRAETSAKLVACLNETQKARWEQLVAASARAAGRMQ